MTFADVHLAVREVLRGSPFSAFLVTVQSAEQHPGRVEVQWSVYVSDAAPKADLFFKGSDPKSILEMLRLRIEDLARARAETEPPPPMGIDAVGAVPADGDVLP